MTYRWFFGFAIVMLILAVGNTWGSMTSPGGATNAPVILAFVVLCILGFQLGIAQRHNDERLDRLERQLGLSRLPVASDKPPDAS